VIPCLFKFSRIQETVWFKFFVCCIVIFDIWVCCCCCCSSIANRGGAKYSDLKEFLDKCCLAVIDVGVNGYILYDLLSFDGVVDKVVSWLLSSRMRVEAILSKRNGSNSCICCGGGGGSTVVFQTN